MGEKRHFILLPVNFFLPVTAGKRFLPVNQLTGDEMKSLIVDVNGDLQLFHSSPCYINVREGTSVVVIRKSSRCVRRLKKRKGRLRIGALLGKANVGIT